MTDWLLGGTLVGSSPFSLIHQQNVWMDTNLDVSNLMCNKQLGGCIYAALYIDVECSQWYWWLGITETDTVLERCRINCNPCILATGHSRWSTAVCGSVFVVTIVGPGLVVCSCSIAGWMWHLICSLDTDRRTDCGSHMGRKMVS